MQGAAQADDPERRRFRAACRARWWRWSRRPAPASRRCCTSPACSSGRTPATSSSAGAPAGGCRDDERTAIRRNDIGFVYQFHHLLPEFSALENVMMPQLIGGLPQAEARERARAAARLHADRQARRITGRPSCRAASSSASPSRAPSPTRRWSCWPTSRPAISIRPPPSYVFEALAALVRAVGPGGADRHPQPRARRAHGPPRHAAGRQGRTALKRPSARCRALRMPGAILPPSRQHDRRRRTDLVSASSAAVTNA